VITVRSLANGKVKYSVPTGTPKQTEAPGTEVALVRHDVGIGSATAIVVTKAGSVAWIAEADEEGGYQVHVFDRAGIWCWPPAWASNHIHSRSLVEMD
jgi:hypothetical protein